jgi:hypothetical protein
MAGPTTEVPMHDHDGWAEHARTRHLRLVRPAVADGSPAMTDQQVHDLLESLVPHDLHAHDLVRRAVQAARRRRRMAWVGSATAAVALGCAGIVVVHALAGSQRSEPSGRVRAVRA